MDDNNNFFVFFCTCRQFKLKTMCQIHLRSNGFPIFTEQLEFNESRHLLRCVKETLKARQSWEADDITKRCLAP